MLAFLPDALRLLGGRLLSGAAGGVRSAGRWVGGLNVWQALALVALGFAIWQHVSLVLDHRYERKVEGQLGRATEVLTANRAALATSRANETALRATLADQSAKVAALAAAGTAQQKAAAMALQRGKGRVAAVDATAAAGNAAARVPPRPGAPCEPSKYQMEHWK